MLRILIVDDHALYADGLKMVVGKLDAEMQWHHEHSAAGGLAFARGAGDLDLILLDFSLPDGDGIQLLRDIKPLQPATPIILLSGNESSRLASQALAAGASGFIPKSLAGDDLVLAVNRVLEGHIFVPVDIYHVPSASTGTLVDGQLLTLGPDVLDLSPAPILIFSHEPGYPIIYANKATFETLGYRHAHPGSTLLQDCLKDPALLQRVTQHLHQSRDIPEFQLTGLDEQPHWFMATCGPVVINKRQCSVLFLRDVSDLKRQEQQLAELANTDVVTGVLNRRGFFDHASREMERARRFNEPFCVLLLDLDHFKRVNDNDGHAAGDQLLVTFARHCKEFLREQDVFSRFGGEEFTALLININAQTGVAVAERLRESWREKARSLAGQSGESTVSVGVVADQANHPNLEQMINQADELLYRAKEAGRNQVVGNAVGEGPEDGKA